MTLETYGDAYTSLLAALNIASNYAHQLHRQTPKYFVERDLALHRAFQSWCKSHGIPVEDMANVRNSIVNHHVVYHNQINNIHYFSHSLPNEFNVRGVWTPE